jgi:hypothetical protein
MQRKNPRSTSSDFSSGRSDRHGGLSAQQHHRSRAHKHPLADAASAATYYPEAKTPVPLSYHDAQSGTPSYKFVPVGISWSRGAAPR